MGLNSVCKENIKKDFSINRGSTYRAGFYRTEATEKQARPFCGLLYTYRDLRQRLATA